MPNLKIMLCLTLLLLFIPGTPHVIQHNDVLRALNSMPKSNGRKLQKSGGIVGILTLPVSKLLKNKIHQNIYESHSEIKIITELNELEKMSFFPGSYVKWLRTHNVQVMPIDIYSSDADLEFLMRTVDGILLTGGAVPLYRGETKIRIDTDLSGLARINDLSFYTRKIKQLVEIAKHLNDERDNSYPIWATCLGFEGLILAQAGFDVRFADMDNENFNSNLKWVEPTAENDFLKFFNKSELERMQKQQMFFFNHDHAFFVSDFNDNENLRKEYRIVASSESKVFKDQNPIVAVIEHVKYPFYGVQFHPEKNQYESKINADRSKPTLKIMDKFAEFFCQKLKKNGDFGDLKAAEDKLENYSVYVGSNIGVFDEVFIFQKK